MKKLDIEIQQINRIAGRRQSCLFDVLKTIAGYLKISLDYIYINEFEFLFDCGKYNSSGLIGESIQQTVDQSLENLKSLYGYELVYNYFNSFDEELSYVKECLSKDFPAVIHFDSFYLPWDPFYNRVHNKHLFLITGIDEKNMCIVDPYFNKQNEQLSIESIKQASNFYIYFEKKETQPVVLDIKKLLRENYQKKDFTPSKNYLNLELFSQAYLTGFSKEKEFVEKVFDQNLIFRNLSDCVLKNGLFLELIESQIQKGSDENLVSIKEELKKVIQVWNDIITLIALNHFKDNLNNTKQISDLISEQAYKYENILNTLNLFIN